jgi:hypothetical protein
MAIGARAEGLARNRMTTTPAPAVDLLWIPLGAGGHAVRLNGKVYEALAALWNTARGTLSTIPLWEVSVPDARYVIESAPIRDQRGRERGVVAEGRSERDGPAWV